MEKAQNKGAPIPAPFFFLYTAITVYALFGSPTPDNPGITEAIIGGFLVLAIIGAGLTKSFSLTPERGLFLKTLQVLFLTGLVLPSLAGAYFGNDRMLILRDILAFAFLGLPLFFTDKFSDHSRAAGILSGLLMVAGIVFCLRTLVPAFNIWIPQGELLYLSNSPLALFAAVYLAGTVWIFLENFLRSNVPVILASLTGLAILLAAMLLDVQRATIGAVVLTWIILAVVGLIKHPRRIVLPLFILALLAVAFFPLVSGGFQAIAAKTETVGLNARLAEAHAVYQSLAVDPVSLFIGQGWGSSYASPAVAGLEVNYTHSLLTTMALKGGAVLFALASLMVLAALCQIFLIFQKDRVKGLALFWSLTIPVFLYASHKSLDFGFVLLMIGVWSNSPGPLHKSHSSGKTEGHPQQNEVG